MEGMHIVRDLLQKNDWMTRIDLKDAYFSIPINPQYQNFLRFKWQTRAYQFTYLPFGLASAPRVFTRFFAKLWGSYAAKGYVVSFLSLPQEKMEVHVIIKEAKVILELQKI
jgi:hypothetical protein